MLFIKSREAGRHVSYCINLPPLLRTVRASVLRIARDMQDCRTCRYRIVFFRCKLTSTHTAHTVHKKKDTINEFRLLT